MPASHLILISHALTESQRQGRFAVASEPLVQPRPTAPALTWRSGSRLLLAPEPRARESATLWPGLLDLPISVDPELRDLDCGRWQGMELRAVEQAEPQALLQWLIDPETAPHGGESFADLRLRMTSWMDAYPAGTSCVAITHPMVVRAVAGQVLGIPLAQLSRLDIAPLARLELSRLDHWRMRLG